MNERIREFLVSENKSSAQLADEIGVQPSGISHILSGRNNPSLDFVLKMLEKYQYLSTEWLLFGKGSMYREVRMQSLFDENQTVNEIADVNTADDSMNYEERASSGADTVKKESSAVRPAAGNDHSVRKIVWFYSDNSFEEYYPSGSD